MVLVLGVYAAIIWLLFFKFKIFPWGTFSKTVVSLVGLTILITFMALLNSRAPSGRVTVVAPVVEIAPRVSGTVTEVPVSANAKVAKGTVLIRLDPTPFDYAVKLAQANFDIAEKTFSRRQAASNANASTVSKQTLDEAQSVLTAAEAQLLQARFERAGVEITAPSDGEVTAVNLQLGDRISAYSGVLPLVRTEQAVVGGIFKQNGSAAIQPGTPVGIAFSKFPGRIFWTEVETELTGMSGGHVQTGATLVDPDSLGKGDELLVRLRWPSGLTTEDLQPGAVGQATVIGDGAGPIGSLAKILLWVRAYAEYL